MTAQRISATRRATPARGIMTDEAARIIVWDAGNNVPADIGVFASFPVFGASSEIARLNDWVTQLV